MRLPASITPGGGTRTMLAWTIYLSFLGVLLLLLLPARCKELTRWTALGTALAGLAVSVAGAVASPPSSGMVTLVDTPWIPVLGIRYHLAADGISVVLVWLTGIAAVAGILFSWNIEHRVREFFAFYLALIGGVYGVFLSADAFLFFAFYELAIIPKYFLIAIWGSTRREYGAMKLALYSFVGSALVLVGLIAAYVLSGAHSFGLADLAAYPYPASFQNWAFPVVFIGFGILAGLWPFHTWAPTGHVAAPTAASMLLAGVVMKLGAYGCLRVAMTLFPDGTREWAWVFGLLGLIGIVYGGLVALVQKDLKFVIGYSSISHMGFVLLGLMTLDVIGLCGAVLQMFSHGVIAGLLFAVVGRMVYDRAHTRELASLQALGLNKALPFAAVVFALAGFASMGLPGFSGFVAELQVLIGAWQAFPWFAVVSGLGILIAVAYTLRALQKTFFGSESGAPLQRPASAENLPPISAPEKIGALLLLACSIAVGLYPNLLLRWIEPAVRAMSALLPGGRP
jgi:NADH-quinone oxidoreductase subunit M